MRSDSKARDLGAFTRIVELMAFVEGLREFTRDEIRDTVSEFCELPPDAQRTLSMEEVVFWAGVATGADICRGIEEDLLDADTADRILTYSSLFAHSTKTAVVDVALNQLELFQDAA